MFSLAKAVVHFNKNGRGICSRIGSVYLYWKRSDIRFIKDWLSNLLVLLTKKRGAVSNE